MCGGEGGNPALGGVSSSITSVTSTRHIAQSNTQCLTIGPGNPSNQLRADTLWQWLNKEKVREVPLVVISIQSPPKAATCGTYTIMIGGSKFTTCYIQCIPGKFRQECGQLSGTPHRSQFQLLQCMEAYSTSTNLPKHSPHKPSEGP